MSSVLSGFFTIWVVIGVGWLLAQLTILDTNAQVTLGRVAFYVGSPALLFTLMAGADLHRVFTLNLVVQLVAAVGSAGIFLIIDALRWHSSLSRKVLGSFCASYVNAGNLGIPIAAYVLGDAAWVAPILLIQVLLLQPIGITLLDLDESRRSGRRGGRWANLTIPLRNPMTIGMLAGLVVNLAQISVPVVILDPINLLGDLAIPTMLLAFGIALRRGPLPGRGADTPATVVAAVLKLVVQPLLAFGLARAVGLGSAETLAVVVIAGLPTAQNVFVLAVRFQQALVLTRDAVFITTIASIPTILGIAWLLG